MKVYLMKYLLFWVWVLIFMGVSYYFMFDYVL